MKTPKIKLAGKSLLVKHQSLTHDALRQKSSSLKAYDLEEAVAWCQENNKRGVVSSAIWPLPIDKESQNHQQTIRWRRQVWQGEAILLSPNQRGGTLAGAVFEKPLQMHAGHQRNRSVGSRCQNFKDQSTGEQEMSPRIYRLIQTRASCSGQ